MKTTRQRLLNIVIAMSVAVNLVMLGGLGYLAFLNNRVQNIHSAMRAPVVIYIPKTMASSGVKTSLVSPAIP